MEKRNGIGFDETRLGNTGSISQIANIPNKKGYEVSVDYLTLIVKYDLLTDLSEIIDVVEGNLGEKIDYCYDLPRFRGKKYAGSTQESLYGTEVSSIPPGDEEGEKGEARIVIPGRALAAANPSDIRDMCQILAALYEVKCNRFDVAIDDYNKLLDIDVIRQAQENGDFAYVDTFGYYETGERGKRDRGRTVTMGSRQSEAFVRCYDKSVQSNGEIDAIRYETEFKKDKADSLFSEWIDFPIHHEQVAAKHIAGAALGAVRFCDRSSGDNNLDRLDDLPWYKEICDSVASGFRVRLKKKERFLDRAIGWVEKAVMPTLAMIRKYMGADDKFLQWLFDGTTEKMGELSSIKLEMIKLQQKLDKEQQIDSHVRKYNNTYRPNPAKSNDELVKSRKNTTDLRQRIARDKRLSDIRETKRKIAESFFPKKKEA